MPGRLLEPPPPLRQLLVPGMAYRELDVAARKAARASRGAGGGGGGGGRVLPQVDTADDSVLPRPVELLLHLSSDSRQQQLAKLEREVSVEGRVLPPYMLAVSHELRAAALPPVPLLPLRGVAVKEARAVATTAPLLAPGLLSRVVASCSELALSVLAR